MLGRDQGEGRADTLLRISVHNKPKAVTIKLEGKIVGPWVEEVRQAWLSLGPCLKSKRVWVDLCGVTAVDAAGTRLLSDIRESGARFRADTPLTKYFIEEIEQRKNIS